MFVAGPPCRWAKWGVQDKSVTLFTHLHLRKKQVWGSYAPQLGTTFLLFNFFLWLLCDRQLFCDFIFCFGVICWHQQLPHLLYGWQEKRSSGRKIGASTETFNYLFHGFYPSFLSPPIFFPVFVLLWLLSLPTHSTCDHPPTHGRCQLITMPCLQASEFWKWQYPELSNYRRISGGCLFMQILCFWHTRCRESTEFLTQAMVQNKTKKPRKFKITEYNHL